VNADPRVPRRDALLRPATMAGVISQRLHAGVPVERIERHYVKYRVGESLRVVYRYALDDRIHFAAARSGRSGGTPAPEVGATLFPFPHDRKLTRLHALTGPVLERALGEPVTARLVAYAAEQSATAEIRDRHDRVIAYAKVGSDEARGYAALAGTQVRVPRILDYHDGLLVLEALIGRPVESLPAFGATLARLHATAVDAPRFERLDTSRLETAARVIATARPDCADAANRLLDRLRDAPETPDVTLHGDANLGNAVQLAGGRVALLDLEHLAVGPAEADLGQVLANLLVNRRHGAKAFLAGYDRPFDAAALRWHTAASILARIALPAISRYRPHQLAQLRELLDAGAGLITPVPA
jgi:aminoglycoside phosphotransferase